jgi:hypothetical protein
MADRRTSGGYPKVATVITADIGLAGQLGPGDTIAFAVCSRGEALAALIRTGTAADGDGGRASMNEPAFAAVLQDAVRRNARRNCRSRP